LILDQPRSAPAEPDHPQLAKRDRPRHVTVAELNSIFTDRQAIDQELFPAPQLNQPVTGIGSAARIGCLRRPDHRTNPSTE
jgi:hypothetical protein